MNDLEIKIFLNISFLKVQIWDWREKKLPNIFWLIFCPLDNRIRGSAYFCESGSRKPKWWGSISNGSDPYDF